MDPEFHVDGHGLEQAVRLLSQRDALPRAGLDLPSVMPDAGIGSAQTLDLLASTVLAGAARLGDPTTTAHMDPPTPWITWATTMWNAALNQNLLHPATAPAAREIERLVVDWIAPLFGMAGGHMLPGSTLANITALWAAREQRGVTSVVVSDSAHVSMAKAASLLGLALHEVPSEPSGAIVAEALPDDLSRSALVLMAGTTSTGAIDDLSLAGRAAWTHVDAAWAGPLRFSHLHAAKLDGVQAADSVAISAHKWLFQPKESALILFRDAAGAHDALSFGGAYLAAPNVGIMGSHGAAAVPLLATLLAWGRQGLAARIERCMDAAEEMARFFADHPQLRLLCPPVTGVVVWRHADPGLTERLHSMLAVGSTSLTTLSGVRWCRNVAANPNLDVDAFLAMVSEALDALPRVAAERLPASVEPDRCIHLL